ncbi:MAG: hypothetical protein HOE90_05770 [Bacteriovoracaceae bacterium]|jgi:hypothetical protein|nr:hypothetical protein [Bacteriovoracaceae bacterium]
MSSFKNQIKNYYQSKELSASQLERLQGKSSMSLLWSAGAGLAISCFALLIFFSTAKIENQIVDEIVYNHGKNLSVEISSSDLIKIGKALPKLDFTLAQSSRLPPGKWKVLGARYCSIQGKIAAQLKLENISNGHVYTLYQTHLTKEMKGIDHKDQVSGASVQLWTEKGLLMGLVGP